MDTHADSKVFSPDSTVSLLFVSPEWLFNGNDRNLATVQRLCASGKVCLVAINEAHLIYDWQDFRQSYKKCEEVHTLFPGVPVMALSATVTPQVHTALTTILTDPVIETSSVNRSNVFLAAEPCNYKRAEGSKQSISLDSRDFNTFADRVNDIISDICTIVYTDFACHVAPIVLALRDRNIQAVSYYGKMKEGEKQESYFKWKSGEIQAIVATRAFGLGINKPNVRYKKNMLFVMDCLPHFLLGHKSLAELDVMVINHLPTFFTLIMTFTMLVSRHVVWLNSSALMILMM